MVDESEDIKPNKSEDDKFLAKKCDENEIEAKESVWNDFLNKTACALFGMVWLPIQIVFSQFPYIINTAPETWSLPSDVSFMSVLGNLMFLIHFFNKRRLKSHDTPIIFSLYIINIASFIGLAFTYDIITPVFGHPHSVCLFVCTFLLCCTGSMFNLLSFNYMGCLKKEYMYPFFMGQAVEAALSGGMGIIQVTMNGGSCPNSKIIFTSKHIFLIGAFLQILCILSFLRLSQLAKLSTPKDECKRDKEPRTTSRRSYFVVLVGLRLVLSCFDFGILTGVQSYSCLPYRFGKLVYQITVTFYQFVGGIVTYLVSFTNHRSTKRLLVLIPIQLSIYCYVVTTAFMSPYPPLYDSVAGSVHIVSIWSVGFMLSSYAKVAIPAILREKSPKHLYYFGAATQLGSSLGSLVSFITTNFTDLLQSGESGACKT